MGAARGVCSCEGGDGDYEERALPRDLGHTRASRGRAAIEELLGRMLKANSGKVTQNTTIERVRFLAQDIALVDGAWTITGAVDAAGKESAG